MLWQSGVDAPAATEEGTEALDPDAALRDWIRARRVCWDSAPLAEWHDRRRVQVGYEVTLYAAHPQGLAADPGSPESEVLYAKLEELARRVSPPASSDIACRFAPFVPALRLRPENEWTPEVSGTLEVVHSRETFAQADQPQRLCLREIERRLEELGVRQRSWRRR